jgi:hypothetical protein
MQTAPDSEASSQQTSPHCSVGISFAVLVVTILIVRAKSTGTLQVQHITFVFRATGYLAKPQSGPQGR